MNIPITREKQMMQATDSSKTVDEDFYTFEKRFVNHQKQIHRRSIVDREWDGCLEPTNSLPLQGKLLDV